MQGEHDCPMCPMEMRNLYAVAFNLLSRAERGASPCSIHDSFRELRRAVELVQPMVDAHFAAVSSA